MKQFKLAVLYLLMVIVFGFIYYVFWLNDSSRFVIAGDYNERTFSRIEASLPWKIDPQKVKKTNVPITINEFNETLLPLSRKYYKQETQKRRLLKNKRMIEREEKKLSRYLDKDYEKNRKSFEKQRVGGYEKKIADLKKKISTLNKSRIPDQAIEASRLEVELAKTEVEKAESAYRVSSAVLDRAKFIDQEVLAQWQATYASLIKSAERIENNRRKQEKVKQEMAKLATRFHDNRVTKVNLLDLLYFSVVTATTTGYGDIAPNDTFVRGIVGLQIIISIIIMGVFVQSLKNDGPQYVKLPPADIDNPTKGKAGIDSKSL